jgi:hypothetical protein
LLLQALLAGAATLLLFAVFFEPGMTFPLAKILSATSLLHLLFVFSEVTLTHPTAHAQLAVDSLTRGAFRLYFWGGIAALSLGVAAPWLGSTTAVFALGGLLAYEHAYVQSGQAVPLA